MFDNPTNYSNSNPSQVTEVYWIFADRKKGNYPKPTPKSGKWMIFVPVKDIDEVWAKIKKATEDGRLGFASKVATARPNPNSLSPNQRVICVYTYDHEDESDVKRIREELRMLGMTHKIPYKTDEDTRSGKYRKTGEKRVSKYYE